MPEQQRGRKLSRDFAFQSTDQSVGQSFGEEAPQQASSAQQQYRYEARPATNGPFVPSEPTQASALDQSSRYPDFGAHHSSLPQPGPLGQLPGGYDFNSNAPLVWDWGQGIEFADYTPQYEPQGELVQELQTQQAPTNEFSIPLPVTNTDTVYPPPQPAVQKPLSSSPKPAQQLPVQTSMKRKADTDATSGVSQGPFKRSGERDAKRPSRSRASSIVSATSPVVATATTTPNPRAPATLTASMSAPAAVEGNTQSGNEAQKRREPSKGTGPEGRVIDVSTPRRIAESRGTVEMLPSGKVFPIQIGSELFRLSGASISSDGEHHVNFSFTAKHKLTVKERPHTFPIFSENRFTTTKVALVT